MFKEQVAEELRKHTKFPKEDIIRLLEKPKYSNLGDVAFPCFDISKLNKKSPNVIAMEIARQMTIPPKGIKRVQALGPYVNFFLDKEQVGHKVINEILEKKNKYGASPLGKGKTIVVDFSHPNIAKPMGIAHLRSTVIGNSLCNIFSFMQYRCIRMNHLGDYGTQFGKLLLAYKKWGAKLEKEMKEEPIKTMLYLYTRFTAEAENNPDLNVEARKMFKLLEDGDKWAVSIWKKFRELSLKDFKRIYGLLGVDFNVYGGESFYIDGAKKALKSLVDQKIAVESAGALIVEFPEFGSPLIVRKSDGTTLYSTRDLAAAKSWYDKYKFDKVVYVVASEQNLYFKQLFKTMEKMGYPWADDSHHVNFGMIYLPEGKMSTRAGTAIFLDDVLNKLFDLTRLLVKDPKLSEEQKDKIAKAVGVSALVYGDLSNDRIKDVKFDWNNLLKLEGDSGPYIQYTYARAKSIIRNAQSMKLTKQDFQPVSLAPEEETLIMDLTEFPEIVAEASEKMSPHIIAGYITRLSDHFNTFYEKCPVLKEGIDKKTIESRLALIAAASQVLNTGMKLLGMIPLEKM